MAKTDENCSSIDLGYAKALRMFRSFHPLNFDALCKTLSDEECITLNWYSFERRKGIFAFEWLDKIDKPKDTEFSPKEEFYSKLKQKGIHDEEYNQAIKGWNETGCKTIKNYMSNCLERDVLL